MKKYNIETFIQIDSYRNVNINAYNYIQEMKSLLLIYCKLLAEIIEGG